MTEFELVKQALWMVPDDQSGWIYHRWLIGTGEDANILEREIEMIEELRQEEPDSRCECLLNKLKPKPNLHLCPKIPHAPR
jgi:hypothetical protein